MLYTEELLEHYRHPQNFGPIESPTHNITLQNPLCGDVITLFLEVKNDVVKHVSFVGKGCAISTAAASLMTEYIKGKNVDKLRNLDRKSTMDIVGIEISPGRIKCLLLPFEALKKLITK
ncbi:SUF system NifU family Fe-S cluster assembly protein [Candidatus Roizmanbacteria bacterium]|jgi:nitrogen fixation NifU-like protein|nr:MAG: SUF system NifU family Fe-S cluster assembly protein [Candidatus Roizmanbacteria bacterium]